ncbi:ankyrin-1-like [Solea senegalensis]|uniref:Ankyrin-1-like n=1 Tax=Solea senegalensis TaxID=28829 RepID=A0AAV6PM10_SOLSE|nr:ankyrin-1-like [Solea senegalensis]
MYNMIRGFDAQTVSNYINPYAVDVIRSKRRDLVYGISHTEDLLDLLVTEGVMTAAKRSIILTTGTRTDQNSRVLDILEARGERACRRFFHPCLMLAEPDLYQRIRTYVEHINKHIKDTRRQLIGYLLEKEKEGKGRRGTKTFDSEANERFSNDSDDSDRVQTKKIEDKAAQGKAENLMYMIATDGELVLLEELEELLDDTSVNTVTSSDETLLHVAAKHGHLSIIELLIRKGARIDLQDNSGHTALHEAASRGHTEIVSGSPQ